MERCWPVTVAVSRSDRKTAMSPSQVKAYLNRDWSLVRDQKHRYWAERKRTLSAQEALIIAEGLRQQARTLRPDWPGDRQREADLKTHIHVAECLRRVPATAFA